MRNMSIAVYAKALDLPACALSENTCLPNPRCKMHKNGVYIGVALIYYRLLFPETRCFVLKSVASFGQPSTEFNSSEELSILQNSADLTPFYHAVNVEKLDFLPGFIGPTTMSYMHLLYNATAFIPVRTLDMRTLYKAHLVTFPVLGMLVNVFVHIYSKHARNSLLPYFRLSQSLFSVLIIRYACKVVNCLIVLNDNLKDPLSHYSGYFSVRKLDNFRLASFIASYDIQRCRNILARFQSPFCSALIQDMDPLDLLPTSQAHFLSSGQPNVLVFAGALRFPYRSCDIRVVRVEEIVMFYGFSGAYSSLRHPPVITPDINRMTSTISSRELGAQPLIADAHLRNCHGHRTAKLRRPMKLDQLREIFLLYLSVQFLALALYAIEMLSQLYFISCFLFLFN